MEARGHVSSDNKDYDYLLVGLRGIAIGTVTEAKNPLTAVAAKNVALYIYRTGLAQGVPGDNYLVWEVEVTNGADVREFVYVDAHTNKVVDQITGIYDDLNRRAYDGMNLPNVPPGYPSTPFWVEGTGVPDK